MHTQYVFSVLANRQDFKLLADEHTGGHSCCGCTAKRHSVLRGYANKMSHFSWIHKQDVISLNQKQNIILLVGEKTKWYSAYCAETIYHSSC
jgi:hypothetical protein